MEFRRTSFATDSKVSLRLNKENLGYSPRQELRHSMTNDKPAGDADEDPETREHQVEAELKLAEEHVAKLDGVVEEIRNNLKIAKDSSAYHADELVKRTETTAALASAELVSKVRRFLESELIGEIKAFMDGPITNKIKNFLDVSFAEHVRAVTDRQVENVRKVQ